MPTALASAPRTSPLPAKGMPRREFFDGVVSTLKQSLPEPFSSFRHRSNPMLLKVDYGNERIHYEVMVDSPRGRLEIGLHFEDGPVSTAAFLAYFDAHIVELKHDLGAQVELERWTASWGHVFETRPLGRLDAPLAADVAARLAAYIGALQPLVEAANVPAERSAGPSEPRGPWRKWKRG